mgnify:CR=1 FL=1
MKTIYKNGAVYTGKLPLVEAFAVEDGKFVFAGSSAEADALAAAGDKVVDLGGKFVCSGFNDSHMHLLNYGSSLLKAQLAAHTESLEDMLACLDTFQKEHPRKDGAWLMGRGWNQDYFTDVDRMPNRYDLDRVSTEVPICATRACGHCLVVNSKALELLGVTADTPQPEGGEIGMENGEPDGRFFDNAMEPVYDSIPVPSKEEIKDMIRSACKALNSYGVTSSQSDDYCVYRAVPWQTVNEAYKELEDSGELTVRVYEQSNFTDLESLKGFVEAGNVTGIGTDRFKIGPLKFLTGTVWKPGNNIFGILPMIVGSICVTGLAILMGVPVAILTSVFLSRYCPKKFYGICKSGINLMAGIPSIVYGFFGLVLMVPLIRNTFGGTGTSWLAASLLLGIMILPTIIGVSESAINAVPSSYYEGSLALGASHERSVFFATLPAAKSGILAGVILGVGRAIGETMAVIMVAGNQARMPKGILQGVRTMTANIVLEMGYATDLHREALIATAVVLFVFILIINLSFSIISRKANA